MKNKLISEISRQMLPYLDNAQMQQLEYVLQNCLWNVTVSDMPLEQEKESNEELLSSFISAKRVEGCSKKTLKYYESSIGKLFSIVGMHVTKMQTDDLRNYLSDYQKLNNCSKSNIDNIRRIHKIKTNKTVKETYTDEALETMRDKCGNIRDLAMIDLLSSTGMRVGELVHLNREDIDFENRECIVFGKGSKERPVYFDARTKIHLYNYLESRTDNNPALFVSLLKPYNRLEISGVEIRLRKLGRKLGITKVHPHKFRRTLATKAIDKGMPIEQVQQLLGHAKIDTTMQYAMVSQNNVKISHRRYIG